LEDNSKSESDQSKSTFLFFMFVFGLLLPLYEIITLLSVVATVIDPLYPAYNTVLSLMGPSTMAFLFACICYAALPEKSELWKPIIVVMILSFAVFTIDTYIPIAGYVDDANLWSLIVLNISIYIISVILAIGGFTRKPSISED